MRVLVTGASGFVGTALCRELITRGHSVRAAVRNKNALRAPSSGLHEVLIPDIAADFDIRALVDGIDTIVHLAAVAHRATDEAQLRRVNVDAARRLAEAAVGSVRRFVLVSSVKVHGEDSGAGAFSEGDALRPEDSYGRSKLEAEQALAEVTAGGGTELVTVRPPLVYGLGVKANFLRLLRWVASGLPLPFASVHNRRSLIYLGNLIDVLVRCTEHPAVRGPLLVCDEEIVSTPELASRIARTLDCPARIFPVPLPLLRLAGTIAGRGDEIRRLTGNLAIDSSRVRRMLDWHPRYTLDKGLADTARWFRSKRR
jgi:nucleoside-diphosphate-sugar epimerase